MVRKTSTNIEIRSCLTSAKRNDRRGRQQNHYGYALNKAKGWNFRRYLESKERITTVKPSIPEDVSHILYVNTDFDSNLNLLRVSLWTKDTILEIIAFQFDFNGEFSDNNTIVTEHTNNPFQKFNVINNLEHISSRNVSESSVVNGYTIDPINVVELSSEKTVVLEILNASDIDLKKVVLTDRNCDSYTLNLHVSNDSTLETAQSSAVSQDLFDLVENYSELVLI